MNEITIDQLYELYLDTAAKCNSQITSLDSGELEYNLFEEFDIGVTSFFHNDSLQKLCSLPERRDSQKLVQIER